MVEINPPLGRLLDINSTNGTLVNGRKATTADLRDGDLIKAGKTVIHVSLQDVGSQSYESLAISQASGLPDSFERAAIVEPPPPPSVAPLASNNSSAQNVETLLPPVGIVTYAGPCRVCASPLSGLPNLGYRPD